LRLKQKKSQSCKQLILLISAARWPVLGAETVKFSDICHRFKPVLQGRFWDSCGRLRPAFARRHNRIVTIKSVSLRLLKLQKNFGIKIRITPLAKESDNVGYLYTPLEGDEILNPCTPFLSAILTAC
jgi:hypothetical protein